MLSSSRWEDFLLDEVFSSAALQQVKGAARRRLQRCMKRDVAGEQASVTEQDWIDALAREIFKTKKLNDSTRQKALSQLIQVSPGGILAMAWLCENAGETIMVDKIISFACELINPETEVNFAREASLEPLKKEESLYCGKALVSKPELSNNDRVCLFICLLVSDYLSKEGRLALIEQSLGIRGFTADNKLTICQWALGLDVEKSVSSGFLKQPVYAPNFLARKAVTCLAKATENAPKVLRHIVENISYWSDDIMPLLHGVLDLMSLMDPEERIDLQNQKFKVQCTALYDLCRNYGDASVRRRAYALAAETESDEFLRSALHDDDLGVRNWALAYFNKRR